MVDAFLLVVIISRPWRIRKSPEEETVIHHSINLPFGE